MYLQYGRDNVDIALKRKQEKVPFDPAFTFCMPYRWLVPDIMTALSMKFFRAGETSLLISSP